MSRSAPTPVWLQVFACVSFAAVVGMIGWTTLFAPVRNPQAVGATAAQPEVDNELPQSQSARPFSPMPGASKPVPIGSNQATDPALPVGVTPKIPAALIANWQQAEGPELAVAFVAEWAAKDPAAAGRWIAAQPDSPARHAGAEALAGIWAGRDIHAATKWAMALPDDGIIKAVVLERLAMLWAEKDPVAGAGYYGLLPAGETRKVVVGALFEKWGARDPAGLHAALGRLPASIADEARMSLAPVLFPRNSSAAMNVLCEVKDREQRINALSQLYDYWRRRSRASASAWLSSSPLQEAERSLVSGAQ